MPVTLSAMETDAYCKALARLCPEDLLALLGHQDAQLLSTDIVELRDIRRRVDSVLKLRRGDETYFLHLEFQARPDAEMNPRCFLYNTQLILQYKIPVITVIIYLLRYEDLPEPIFRVKLGGQEINHWTFQCVRLWELEAQAVLDQGLPGLAALVPLMNAVQWEHMEQAVHQIETTAPPEQQADLLAILHALGQYRYTIEWLNQILDTRLLR